MNFLIPIFEKTQVTDIPTNYLENFSGKTSEQVLYIDPQGNKYFVIGLGDIKDKKAVIATIRSFFYKQKNYLSGKIIIKLIGAEIANYIEQISHGIYLAQYEIGYLKQQTKKKESWYDNAPEFIFEGADNPEALARGKAFAQTQMRIMRWADAPGNYKTPQILSRWIADAGQESGFEVEIFDAAACEKMGMHALLAVGRGSIENPPLFCLLKYSSPNATKTIGLVGKGVTFDTGGVSLKPGDNMNYMKSDMGGAAAVAGTIEMAAKLQLPINIIGAIPITENCIDSYAIKPGDVIGSYSGKTIEVINTDAEGRLILADALSYITTNYTIDTLIDLATLTGNVIMSLGYKAAGMMTQNDQLANQIYEAGINTGEKVWRLPLWDEYKDALKSDIADVKNLAASPIGGAINAGKFLEVFTNEHRSWVHLDIAGAAFGDSEYGSMKSATGFGVNLLINYLEKII